MNPEELLTTVEFAIKTRPASSCPYYDVGVLNGRIVCLPRNESRRGFTRVCVIRNGEIEKGFTKLQWIAIRTKLANHMEKIKSCPKHRKP